MVHTAVKSVQHPLLVRLSMGRDDRRSVWELLLKRAGPVLFRGLGDVGNFNSKHIY